MAPELRIRRSHCKRFLDPIEPSALELGKNRVEVLRTDETLGEGDADPEIWEAVVAMPKFRGERLTEVALYPITLGHGKARSVRGRPMFAEGPLGQKILGDLVKLSAVYGTKVTIRNGIGFVEIPAPSATAQ